MKNRLARLLKVLAWYPRSGAPDIDVIALQLGVTPATVRRDLRDLREAGAFDRTARVPTSEERLGDGRRSGALAALALQPAANDGPPRAAHPAAAKGLPEHARTESIAAETSDERAPSAPDDEWLAMYVGARFLASEGDPALGLRALRVARKVEREAPESVRDALATMDARFRFGPRETERRVRMTVARAIQERRALTLRYKGERDTEHRIRVVEPSAQFFIHDRWSFYAFDRESGEVRQFRHERCRDVALTDEPFTSGRERAMSPSSTARRRVQG
jgi:predicted DNA-binding transcriptional regulator YafY